MPSPLREVVVDLAAVRSNAAVLCERSAPADVMAVVKADAYGHGLVPVAQAALDGGATRLGVALLSEAFALRTSGVTAPILAWLLGPDEPLTEAIAADIELSVNTTDGLDSICDAAVTAGMAARVHLNIDTGLGRGGSTFAQWLELCEHARKRELDGHVAVVGVWSHFAYADAPGHPTIDKQLDVFNEALTVSQGVGLHPLTRHLANSAATLTRVDARFDCTRPGLALYGLSPIPQERSARDLGLRPAMTMTAAFTLVKRVPAGQGVSYQHEYVTRQATTLGLLPIGYADGVPRAATNVGPLLAAGRRRTVAGVVCMDQIVVDVGDDPLDVGDRALIFGPGDHGEPTAQDWAEATGTISYEIVTRIGHRVVRRYINQ